VVLEGITHAVDLKANAPTPERFELALSVLTEPGVAVLAYPRGVHFSAFVDEKGHSLVPEGEQDWDAAEKRKPVRTVQAPVPGVGRLTLPLSPPEGAGQRIAKFEGKVEVVVALKTEKVALMLEQAEEGMEKEVAGMKVTVGALKQQTPYYTSTVTDEKGQATDEAWGKLSKGLAGAPAVVLDQGGVSLQTFDGATSTSDGDSVTVTQRFYAGGGAQARTVKRVEVAVPTEVEVLALPVEFADLVLP
jgi:hypothetical protein